MMMICVCKSTLTETYNTGVPIDLYGSLITLWPDCWQRSLLCNEDIWTQQATHMACEWQAKHKRTQRDKKKKKKKKKIKTTEAFFRPQRAQKNNMLCSNFSCH